MAQFKVKPPSSPSHDSGDPELWIYSQVAWQTPALGNTKILKVHLAILAVEGRERKVEVEERGKEGRKETGGRCGPRRSEASEHVQSFPLLQGKIYSGV